MSGFAYPQLDSGTAAATPHGAGTAANIATNSGSKAALVTGPGNWAINHNPAANTKATISQAAVAATRHVCTGFMATFVAGAAAPTAVQVAVTLRDGATGAGTVLWSGVMALPATAGASSQPLVASDLSIVGSVNTAMTIEFSAAGGANTVEAVSMSGYDVA